MFALRSTASLHRALHKLKDRSVWLGKISFPPLFSSTLSSYSVTKRLIRIRLRSLHTVHVTNSSIIFRKNSGQWKKRAAFEKVFLCQIAALSERTF